MSLIDKALKAVIPQPDAERREQATEKARKIARKGSWLEAVLDHHDAIRLAFADGRKAANVTERKAALRHLRAVLNAHAIAEELVLYPALVEAADKSHASRAYLEHTATKTGMAELEAIAPSRPEWLEKWEAIETNLLIHMYEEESDWLVSLYERGSRVDHLTARYLEEYNNYKGVQATI